MGDRSNRRGKSGAKSLYFVTSVKSGDKKMKEERKLYRKIDKDMTISSTFWKGKKSVIGRYERLQKLDQHAISAPRNLHQRMDDLVKHLISVAKKPVERYRVLFRWIAENIDYDVAGLRDGRGVSTAEEALRRRVAVCGGYVDLLKKFCEKAGLRCESVSGYDKGANYYVGQEDLDSCSHAWSIIYVNGKPFYCDPTWASGSIDKAKTKFTREWREHWFMSDPSLFENTHLPGSSNEGGSVNNRKKTLPPEKWNKIPKLGVMMSITQASLGQKEGVLQAKDNEIDIPIKVKNLVSIQHFLYSKTSGFKQEIPYHVMHFWKKDTVILRVKLPGRGTYKLDVYATKTLKSEGKSQGSTTELHDKLVTYTIIGNSNTRHPTFYKRRYGCLPPDVMKGYACLSHKDTVIETSKNRLVVEMSCPKSGDMIAKLTNQSQPTIALKNRIYQERFEDKHAFHIHLHSPGWYNFAVHNEPSEAGTYTEFVVFMINFTGKSHQQQTVFPEGIKWKPLDKDYSFTCPTHKGTTIRLRNGEGTVKLSRPKKNNERLKLEVRDINSNRIRESENCLFVESVDGKRKSENFTVNCRMSREGFYVLHLYEGRALTMRWLIVCDKSFKGELYPSNNENWGPVWEDFNKLGISFSYPATIRVPNGRTTLKVNVGSKNDLTIFGKLLAPNGTTSFKHAVTVKKPASANSKFVTMDITFPDDLRSGVMELYGGKTNLTNFPCIGKWFLVRK